MAVFYGQPDLSKIEKNIEELKILKWYQKPLGIFLLGFFSGVLSSVVVALILKLL